MTTFHCQGWILKIWHRHKFYVEKPYSHASSPKLQAIHMENTHINNGAARDHTIA